VNINVLGYQRNGSGVCRERTPDLVTKNSSGDRYSYQVHTNEVLSRRIPGKLRSQLSASYGKRAGDPGDFGHPKWLAREFRLLSARNTPLAKTNSETRTRYEPGPGALRGEERIAPEIEGRHRQPA